jgi:endoglucanase
MPKSSVRLLFPLATMLAACIPDVPQAPQTGQPPPVSPPPTDVAPLLANLRRGMNAGNALDAPSEGAWGVVLAPAFFDAVKAQGFDHVRIPIRFSAHAGDSAPYTIDEAFFRRVDWAIDQTVSRGMTAIVDLHHYEELHEHPDAHAARFVGLWAQIAARYAARPPSVVYELLNEPTHELTAARWNALLVRALAAVRAVDRGRTVIVDSVFWAAAKELVNLELPAGDPHLVASFHMYQPILFTHQGMSWMPAEFHTTGIVFPGPPPAPVEPDSGAQRVSWVADWIRRYNTTPAATNPGGYAAVTAEFEMARAFVERTKVPLYMGEFGAGDKADMASRAAWTRAVRKEAEGRGIGWAYWDDGGSFKIYDAKAQTWNPALRAALLE